MGIKQLTIIATIYCPPIISIIEIVSKIKDPDYPEDDQYKDIKSIHYQFAKKNIERLFLNYFSYQRFIDSYEYVEFIEIICNYDLWSTINEALELIQISLPNYASSVQSVTVIGFNGLIKCQYI